MCGLFSPPLSLPFTRPIPNILYLCGNSKNPFHKECHRPRLHLHLLGSRPPLTQLRWAFVDLSHLPLKETCSINPSDKMLGTCFLASFNLLLAAGPAPPPAPEDCPSLSRLGAAPPWGQRAPPSSGLWMPLQQFPLSPDHHTFPVCVVNSPTLNPQCITPSSLKYFLHGASRI